MPESESSAVRAEENSAAAHAQAILNRDNGVDHIRGLLDEGTDRMNAWWAVATRLSGAMAPMPAEIACDFLANLVAATQVALAQRDTPGVDSFPSLVPGVALARKLTTAGLAPLDVWLTVANRTSRAARTVQARVAVVELAEVAAAGQLLLAEQGR